MNNNSDKKITGPEVINLWFSVRRHSTCSVRCYTCNFGVTVEGLTDKKFAAELYRTGWRCGGPKMEATCPRCSGTDRGT